MTTQITSSDIGLHQVWDPWGFENDGTVDPTQTPPRGIYVPGQPKGYSEGETALFTVDMTLEEDGEYTAIVSLDYFGNGAYAFLGIEPWDTTFANAGTTFPALPSGTLTGDVDGFNMIGATIGDTDGIGDADGVTYLGMSFSGGVWRQSWEIDFTVLNDGDSTDGEDFDVDLVYGGHIAAPGDDLASFVEVDFQATQEYQNAGADGITGNPVNADGAGGADTVVPEGFGASNVGGTFQARVGGKGGDKTVNFKGDLIEPLAPPDINIDIDKWTCEIDTDNPMLIPGTNVTWYYVITNTGADPLTNIQVSDNIEGDIDAQGTLVDDGNGDAILDPGESWTYTHTGTVGASNYTNIGSVTGDFVREDNVTFQTSDSDPSAYTVADVPDLTVDKQVSCDGVTWYDVAGSDNTAPEILENETVYYRVLVSAADGNVALENVSVSDPNVSLTRASDQSGNDDNELTSGEVWVYTGSTTAGGSGTTTNTASVTADYTDDCGETLTRSGSDTAAYYGADPGILLVKDVEWIDDGDTIAEVGEILEYSFDISNPGNVDLDDVMLVDTDIGISFNLSDLIQGGLLGANDLMVTESMTADGILEAGEQWDVLYDGYALTEGDLAVEGKMNTATVSSDYADDCGEVETVSSTDDAFVFLPAIQRSIEQDVSGTAFKANCDSDGGFEAIAGSTYIEDASEDGLDLFITGLNVTLESKNGGSWSTLPNVEMTSVWVDDNNNGLLDSGEQILTDSDPTTDGFQFVLGVFEPDDDVTLGFSLETTDGSDLPSQIRIVSEVGIAGRDVTFTDRETVRLNQMGQEDEICDYPELLVS